MRIDPSGFQSALEAATDEAIIEMHAFAVIFGIHPAVTPRAIGFERRKGVYRRADPGDTAIISAASTGKRAIFRRFRLHVEIAHDHVILRQRRLRQIEFTTPRQRSTLLDEGIDMRVQKLQLADALIGGDMVEMHGVDADRPAGCCDYRFGCAALRVDLADRPAARQKQRPGRDNRPARQHHVAELETGARHRLEPAFISFDMHVAGWPIDPEIVGKKGCNIGHHVGKTVAGETASHLLQRDDIGSLEAPGNTRQIVSAVETEAVLYVIARKIHDNL